jgi:tight adherence protein B
MTGLATGYLAALLLGIGSMALLLAGASGGMSRRLEQRVRRCTGTRDPRPARGSPTSLRRGAGQGWLQGVGHAIGGWVPHADALRDRIFRAGVHLGLPELLAISVAILSATAALVYLVAGLPLWLGLVAGVASAVGVPSRFLAWRAKRRAGRIVAMLPEGIDLIVRGLRSGLPVTEALQTIGEEMADPIGPLFREVTGSLRLGVPLDEALWSIARRLDIQELKFLVVSLSIQQQTGGNLAEILQNLSLMIRRREQVKLKIRAMSSEARASALIIGSLPFIMALIIFFVNPSYIEKLVTDPRGWVLLAGAMLSMSIGLAVMARMVRFEI